MSLDIPSLKIWITSIAFQQQLPSFPHFRMDVYMYVLESGFSSVWLVCDSFSSCLLGTWNRHCQSLCSFSFWCWWNIFQPPKSSSAKTIDSFEMWCNHDRVSPLPHPLSPMVTRTYFPPKTSSIRTPASSIVWGDLQVVALSVEVCHGRWTLGVLFLLRLIFFDLCVHVCISVWE